MAEQVTRKFTNKLDGTPRTGLNLRLVSITDPTSDPYPFIEVVTSVEADQGQYFVATPGGSSITEVPHGVYQIQIDEGSGYVNYDGMITVEPGRVQGLEENKFPLLDRVNTAVTHVSAFMGDTEQGTTAVIQRALNYAAATTKFVKVGAWGPGGANVIWTGSPITIPAGVTLDLCGATVYADAATDVPVVSLAGDAAIMNGALKTKFSAGSRVVAVGESTFKATFINVEFIVGNTAYPTAADSVNTERLAVFIGCTGVVLAPPTTGHMIREQVAIGCYTCTEVGGSLSVSGPASANATANEIGQAIRTALANLGSAPDTSAPFANMAEFSEAVKQLWFSKVPSLASSIEPEFQWEGARGSSHPDGDPEKITLTPQTSNGLTRSYSVVRLERKAYVIFENGERTLVIEYAGVLKMVYSDLHSGDYEAVKVDVDFSDLSSALSAKYPSYPTLLGTNMSDAIAASSKLGFAIYETNGTYNPVLYYVFGDNQEFNDWTELIFKWSMISVDYKIRSTIGFRADGAMPVAGNAYLKFGNLIRLKLPSSTDHSVSENPAFGTMTFMKVTEN